MRGFALPTTLGPYEILRRLAAGGMAEVYLAKARGDAGFEKLVAIKRVCAEHGRSGQPPASLSEEAKLSVSLCHPNIVQTFDLGRAEGAEFIVMEHVEGYDAQQVLDALRLTGTELPVDLGAYIVAEVCRGLDYAHSRLDAAGRRAGIVHRDVSPQNVLLSFGGEVKITDFGIAKTRARGSDPESKVIKGKYFYMSPEQASAKPLDHRSDVFSAGVVLWELLTGRRLHEAPDVRTLLRAVRRAEVPPPSSVRSSVPSALDRIVARATAQSPSGRYPSATAMADDLDTFLASRPDFHGVRGLRTLLASLPAPPASDGPGPLFDLPRTRDRVATVSRAARVTPPEPPLRHGLEEGEPTVLGWQSPSFARPLRVWPWTLSCGVLLVGAAAWALYGP